MSGLLTIELKRLRFFAFHGLYAEEKKIGNEFEVNLSVTHLPGTIVITELADTVNYVNLYELVKSEMQKPRELLETLAMEITEHVYASLPHIKKVEISVTKLHPPITKFVGTVGITYQKEF